MAGGQIELVKTQGAALKKAAEAKTVDWQAALAGTGMSVHQFQAGLFQAVRANPRLLEAGAEEVLKAAGRALSLGLDLSGVTGECYAVGPLNKKGSKVVELWMGIRGVIKLAYRSGLVKAIRPVTVHKGDTFKVDPASPDKPIRHTPKGGSGEAVAWYAVAFLESGGVLYGVVWADEMGKLIEQAKARLGNAFPYSPWGTHPEDMALVQALRRALKWAPKSVLDLSRLGEEKPVAAVPALPAEGQSPALEFDPDSLVVEGEVVPTTDDAFAPEWGPQEGEKK